MSQKLKRSIKVEEKYERTCYLVKSLTYTDRWCTQILHCQPKDNVYVTLHKREIYNIENKASYLL